MFKTFKMFEVCLGLFSVATANSFRFPKGEFPFAAIEAINKAQTQQMDSLSDYSSDCTNAIQKQQDDTSLSKALNTYSHELSTCLLRELQDGVQCGSTLDCDPSSTDVKKYCSEAGACLQ
jgi:hypothetical protein